MRVWEHPPFTYRDEFGRRKTYEGLPPKYYYYVPNSNYHGDKPFPQDPLDPSFVSVVDGLGMNFGCPLRLHEAMKVYAQLRLEDRSEPHSGLVDPKKHIATVEELFAAGIWKRAISVSRPKLAASKSYDWDIAFGDVHLYLECKYRPSFWPKNREEFEIMPGAFLKKASEQLPQKRARNSLNVAIITTVCTVDDSIRAACANELNACPHVDALVFLNIVGDASVFSRTMKIARVLQSRIHRIAADDFDGFSPFAYFRPAAEQREHARVKESMRDSSNPFNRVAERDIKTLPARRGLLEPIPLQYPYRCSISRLPDGEPVLTFISPELRILYGSADHLLRMGLRRRVDF